MMKEMSRKAMSHSGLHQQQYYRSQQKFDHQRQTQTLHTAARYDGSELYQQEGVRLRRCLVLPYPRGDNANNIMLTRRTARRLEVGTSTGITRVIFGQTMLYVHIPTRRTSNIKNARHQNATHHEQKNLPHHYSGILTLEIIQHTTTKMRQVLILLILAISSSSWAVRYPVPIGLSPGAAYYGKRCSNINRHH
eukprot:scaffold31046_cov73-Skeletonema_marinoi.AAC.1